MSAEEAPAGSEEGEANGSAQVEAARHYLDPR